MAITFHSRSTEVATGSSVEELTLKMPVYETKYPWNDNTPKSREDRRVRRPNRGLFVICSQVAKSRARDKLSVRILRAYNLCNAYVFPRSYSRFI